MKQTAGELMRRGGRFPRSKEITSPIEEARAINIADIDHFVASGRKITRTGTFPSLSLLIGYPNGLSIMIFTNAKLFAFGELLQICCSRGINIDEKENYKL